MAHPRMTRIMENSKKRMRYSRCPTCGRLPLPPLNEKTLDMTLDAKVTVIYKRLYRYKDRYITRNQIRKILEIFDCKSVVSGETGDLTLKKIDLDRPYEYSNVVLVTIAECFRSLPDEAILKARSIIKKHDSTFLRPENLAFLQDSPPLKKKYSYKTDQEKQVNPISNHESPTPNDKSPTSNSPQFDKDGNTNDKDDRQQTEALPHQLNTASRQEKHNPEDDLILEQGNLIYMPLDV